MESNLESAIEWMSGWYNWPFLFAYALAGLYVLADLVLGGLSEWLGGGADGHAGHLGHDGHADLDLGHAGHAGHADLDLGHAGHAGHLGHDGHAGHMSHAGHWTHTEMADAAHPGFFLQGMLWVGLGRVPLSVILESLLLAFGSIGLIINALWSEVSPDFVVWLSFPVALFGALVGGVVCTKALSSSLARILPSDGTITRAAGGWEGHPGVVTSAVTVHSGQVRVEGQGSTPDVTLSVKRDVSVVEDIPRGSQVVLLNYVASTNSYTVIPLKDGELDL